MNRYQISQCTTVKSSAPDSIMIYTSSTKLSPSNFFGVTLSRNKKLVTLFMAIEGHFIGLSQLSRLDQNKLRRLVRSVRKRCREVIATRGG